MSLPMKHNLRILQVACKSVFHWDDKAHIYSRIACNALTSFLILTTISPSFLLVPPSSYLLWLRANWEFINHLQPWCIFWRPLNLKAVWTALPESKLVFVYDIYHWESHLFFSFWLWMASTFLECRLQVCSDRWLLFTLTWLHFDAYMLSTHRWSRLWIPMTDASCPL